MSTEPNHATGMNPWLRFCITLLFCGLAGYFAYEGDFVVAGISVVTGVSALSGYRIGLLYSLTWLIAIAAAITFAPNVGRNFESQFSEWFGTTGLLNRFMCIGVVGILISLITSTTLVILAGRLMKTRPRLQAANRWLGFSIGGMEGLLMCGCFLGGMLVMEPMEQERAPWRDPSDKRGLLISRVILKTSEQTRESVVGPWIETHNPITHIPQLNKVQQVQRTAAVLSDPAKIQGLLHHPSLRAIQQRPEVRSAVDKLNADPELRSILQSGQPMNRQMAISLLSHPAVMELVDQPGFMAEASKLVRGAIE